MVDLKMGIESVILALEDHANAALAGRNPVHPHPVEKDLPLIGIYKAGKEAKKRGFSTTGGDQPPRRIPGHGCGR
jgi:hypothetical protein